MAYAKIQQNKNTGKEYWYSGQRSWWYASHDENGNENGLTKEEWRKQIRDEWTPQKLNAHHVTIIFHDRCTTKDDHGNIIEKPLHAHIIVYFINNITRTQAQKRLNCSRIDDVKVIKKGKRASAYRYLLHITEKAIKDKKHIYAEDELIVLKMTEDTKYDYHKLILKSEEEEDVQEENTLVKKVIKEISNGVYDGAETVYSETEGGSIESYTLNPIDKLLTIPEIANLMLNSQKHRRAIENALDVRQQILNAMKSKAKIDSKRVTNGVVHHS